MSKNALKDIIMGSDHNINHDLKSKFEEIKKQDPKIEDFFHEFIQQFLSEQTRKAYSHDIKSFFDFISSGAQKINHPKDILDGHFRLYRDQLISQHYSSATINRKLVAIRSLMKWFLAKALIEYNPLDTIKLPKVQTTAATQAFEDYEVIEMLSKPDKKTKMGHTHYMAMLLLFSLGLRRSELSNIKRQDFYQERGHSVLRVFGKGDKIRILPTTQQLNQAVKDYINFLASLGIELHQTDFLLQSTRQGKNKKAIHGSTIYRMINKYVQACGINKKLGPHSCRATAISHLLDTQQTSIRDVAIFAGHSNITTTERYDKRRNNLEKSAAYQINYSQKKKVS